MHYYIDGYNLLFRTLRGGEDLKHKREDVVTLLEGRASLLGLDLTLVFDSQYQPEEATKAHYKSIRVVYTSLGQTADDYILHELKEVSFPSQHTVVTSDRALSDRCRIRMAKTETVEGFLIWIDKRFRNIHKEVAKPLLRAISAVAKTQEEPVEKPEKPPLVGSEAYYLTAFEKAYATAGRGKKRKKESQQFGDSEVLESSDQIPQKIKEKEPKEEPLISENERWLRAFQSRRNHDDDNCL